MFCCWGSRAGCYFGCCLQFRWLVSFDVRLLFRRPFADSVAVCCFGCWGQSYVVMKRVKYVFGLLLCLLCQRGRSRQCLGKVNGANGEGHGSVWGRSLFSRGTFPTNYALQMPLWPFSWGRSRHKKDTFPVCLGDLPHLTGTFPVCSGDLPHLTGAFPFSLAPCGAHAVIMHCLCVAHANRMASSRGVPFFLTG